MIVVRFVFLVSFIFVCFDIANADAKAKSKLNASSVLHALTDEAMDIERKISKMRYSIDDIKKKEKTYAPIVTNVYDILTRSFTLLFNMARFSDLLSVNQQSNKNDFVRCSIIVKNFAKYYSKIGAQLAKANGEMNLIRQDEKNVLSCIKIEHERYEKVCTVIDKTIHELSKKKAENVILNDIILHLATKSSSLEELDAELEAENSVGVLKSKTVVSALRIHSPVVGQIVSEFGDKLENGKMSYHVAFLPMPNAIVASPIEGLVVFCGKFLEYGNIVIINNGDYRIFLYGLDKISAAPGDVLKIGDYIGKAFNTEEKNKRLIKMELRKSGEFLDPRHWLIESLEKEKIK